MGPLLKLNGLAIQECHNAPLQGGLEFVRKLFLAFCMERPGGYEISPEIRGFKGAMGPRASERHAEGIRTVHPVVVQVVGCVVVKGAATSSRVVWSRAMTEIGATLKTGIVQLPEGCKSGIGNP